MLQRPLATLALACLLGTPAAHAATQKWSVLIMGLPAGVLTAEQSGGTLKTHWEFNDRGRGPNLDSTYRLDGAGIPVRLETHGVEYFKAKVSEELTVAGGHAHWKSRAQEGSREVTGPAFYLSYEGSPFESGLLVAAAMKRPDHRLTLLPAGETSARRVTELDVQGSGGKQHVVLWELDGLGFTPAPVWMDREGRFFAAVDDWMSAVPVGFEKALPQLLAAQQKSADEHLAAIARALPERSSGGVAFTGAGIFDADAGVVRPGMTLLVQGDRIAAVGADGTVTIPAGARVIDARGKTLIPGLWDMHVHVGDTDGLLDMAAGVTSVRDMGNDMDSLLQRKKRWDDGTAIGPRLNLAGLIDGPGPFAGPTKVLVDTADKAIAAVDDFASHGYQQIKIYSSVKPELVPVIARRAHEHGLRVSGHIPAGMIAEQAIADGYDEVQHVNFLFLDLWPEITETRTPARFTEVAERAAGVDLDSPPVQKLVDLMRKRDIVSDPTLSAFENLMVDRAGVMPERWVKDAPRLPALFQRNLLAGGLPVPAGKDERYRASFRQTMALVKKLYDSGVRIVAGTDALGGFELHHELETYVKAGIPAPDVLRIATLGAARVMKKDADLGSLVPGKLADLDVVDGDPTQDIGAIDRIRTVMKGGVLYDADAMYAAIGVAPIPR